MSIQEIIEIATMTTIAWKTGEEAAEFIMDFCEKGYSEAEIEKILYLMDNGNSAESAIQSVRN